MVLVQQLCDDVGRGVRFLHLRQKLGGRPRPLPPPLHKGHQPKKDRRHLRRKLFLGFPLHQLPTALTETQGELLVLDVPADGVEGSGVRCPVFLFQHKGGVGAAGQPRCPRYPVEHVAVPLLADVVDDHHRQGVPVREILEQRYVPVVVGIGVVLGRGAYLL